MRRGREAARRATIGVGAGWWAHHAPQHPRGNEQHDQGANREVPSNLAVRPRLLVDLGIIQPMPS